MSIVNLMMHAGLVVKLVLWILLFFSVVSFGIIMFKSLDIYLATRDSQRFLKYFWAIRRFDMVDKGLDSFRYSPLVVQFRNVQQEFQQNQKPGEEATDVSSLNVSVEQDRIARILRRSITTETNKLEKFLPFLATTGSAAPFIGLFGTVWGIMDAFHEIGQSGSASLAVVAPGISEALIATAIGLVAAIPAVIAYNHFVNKVNILIGEMDSFSQEILNFVQRMPRIHQGE
jgi:biopolymer transport protein TolQ